MQSTSSRDVKYKDYFVDEDPAQHESDEEAESAPDHEEDEEDMDAEDFEEYVYMFEVVYFFHEDIVLLLVLTMADSFALCRDDSESRKARDPLRKVTFDLPSESEGEDVEDILGGKSKNITRDTKSVFEKRQEKVRLGEPSVCLMCAFYFVLHWRYMVYVTNK